MAGMDYAKMIVALIRYFGEMEGTDYLNDRAEPAPALDGLTDSEVAELTRLRDIARTQAGEPGYTA
jgi:hypothetical protein